eukprot:1931941-Rhodomonas_salina.1
MADKADKDGVSPASGVSAQGAAARAPLGQVPSASPGLSPALPRLNFDQQRGAVVVWRKGGCGPWSGEKALFLAGEVLSET